LVVLNVLDVFYWCHFLSHSYVLIFLYFLQSQPLLPFFLSPPVSQSEPVQRAGSPPRGRPPRARTFTHNSRAARTSHTHTPTRSDRNLIADGRLLSHTIALVFKNTTENPALFVCNYCHYFLFGFFYFYITLEKKQQQQRKN